ncbi:MAG: hypothetical protein HYY76_13310 [Acidobacteria bacterium]|nr:hypothetical protein [Acidobacteriota bacterium]
MRVYRDDDADLTHIAHERIAVIGYGIQGRAQALNLRDAGLDVCVGNREDRFLLRAAEVGLYTMLESDGSPACRYGLPTHREVVIDESALRREARRILERIRNGAFAEELMDDQRAGHPRLAQLTDASRALPLGEAERRLREALGR